jgi:predicted RNA methylase
MSNLIKGAPAKIYLVFEVTEEVEFNELDGVTWCSTRVGPSDIEYVRADVVMDMETENARLRADLEFTKTASDGKSRVISMLMAENERFRTAIAAALDIDVTEDWYALHQIREILKKAYE